MTGKVRTLRLGESVTDLKRSVMRGLLALAVDPEVISLAGGLPASEFLPAGGEAGATERVTFTGIQQVTAGRGAQLPAISTDSASGADIDELEAALRRDPRPRLVVLVPDFHNPLGVSLTSQKRARAAALAAEYGVPLLEDDPYAALRFRGDPSPPIKA